MKKYFILLALVTVLITGIIIVGQSIRQTLKPASADSAFYDFLITKGSSASQIAAKLEKKGFIRDALVFRFYVQLSGKSKKIQAGEYSLSPSYSLTRVIEILIKGPVEVWVTIPEGLRREEIAGKFASAFGKDEKFIDEFNRASSGLEGFLFPDTYLFPKEATASAVVKKMRSTFDVKTAQLKEAIDASDLSLNEIVTLASIIERETKTNAERPVVAGILLNRLNAGIGLQADATVQYAIATVNCQLSTVNCENWWSPVTKTDLSINSPYNTYKYRGLPPGPIANPGLTSLKAASSPEENDYLYYLHDAKGQIYYAKTLEEHNENVRKYLD